MYNPLKEWFDAHTTGPGIWKWTHYFDIYHRHFERFRGKPVHVAEVGVYSGGSLAMWADYFGPEATIHGIDIQPACLRYANERTHIHIGDQGDAAFWARFKEAVPQLDVFIDDGSHVAAHQRLTLEEILPHMAPGGVYLCEDLLNDRNGEFGEHIGRMTTHLHPNVDIKAMDMLAMGLTPFQRLVESIHVYAHVAVIELRREQPVRFESPAAGSEWIHFDPAWHG